MVLPTSDHVVSGSNPTWGGIQLITIWHFIAWSLTLYEYDLNNVERDVKHQIIIP